MTEEKKVYTAGEAVAIGILMPFAVSLMLIATFPITLYAAWCDMHVWNWFVAPYFRLPAMSIWVSVGIGFWVRLQTTSYTPVEGQKLQVWKGILSSLLTHSSLLLVAYFVQRHFMHK